MQLLRLLVCTLSYQGFCQFRYYTTNNGNIVVPSGVLSHLGIEL